MSGTPTVQRLPDGTVFSDFDSEGRPGHIETPAEDGQPSSEADITYDGDHTRYVYADGTTAIYRGDQLLEQKLEDGTIYTAFDADNRPGHIKTPDTEADVTYRNDQAVYSYADGSAIVRDTASGRMISQQTADGQIYTVFDDEDRPGHITTPGKDGQPATEADIAYDGGNQVVYTYADGSVTIHDTATDTLISQKTPDGQIYSGFDTNDRPGHVYSPAAGGTPESHADITYDGDHTTYTYADGSVTIRDTTTDTLISQQTADGQIYTQFDAQDRPGHVYTPATAGKPEAHADISYRDDRTLYSYADGTTATYHDNRLIEQKLEDGTTYSAFDADNRPGHIKTPDTEADVTYQGDHATYTYTDGSVVVRDTTNDTLISQKTADGRIFTDFDDDRPGHVRTPPKDGEPASGADIEYVGEDTLYHHDDGSVATYRDDDLVQQKLQDGTVYSDFDDRDRPHAVSVPEQQNQSATSAVISYDDRYTTFTYTDKTVLKFDSSTDQIVSQRLPDGKVYTEFDERDRPQHLQVPSYDGKPATEADIYYEQSHVVYAYKDGSVTIHDSATDRLVSQKTPDGRIYTGFDDEDRPGHIFTPADGDKPESHADISYDSDRVTYSYSDESVVVHDSATDRVVTQTTRDGTVYSDFDENGDPGHVKLPAADDRPATSADITYTDDETSYTYQDGSVVTYASGSNTVLTHRTADGDEYSDFDKNGDPRHVEIAARDGKPATSAEITYPEGRTVYSYDDRTVITYDSQTREVITQRTPDGTLYSDFDADGRPQHVKIPAQNGRPATSADIAYDGDRTVYSFTDHTKVIYENEQVVRQEMPDGWVITYGDGRPVRGENLRTGEKVTVEPHDGGLLWIYSDGTRLWVDDEGSPVKMTTADGWTFDEFDGRGRPARGSRTGDDGEVMTVTIVHDFDGNGSTRWIYVEDGEQTTIVTDGNGAPVTQTNPDGTSFEYLVEMARLREAIGVVARERDQIELYIGRIVAKFDDIHREFWRGPASDAFDEHMQSVHHLKTSVFEVLSETVHRMQVSYNLYVEAERVSHDNLTPVPVDKSPYA